VDEGHKKETHSGEENEEADNEEEGDKEEGDEEELWTSTYAVCSVDVGCCWMQNSTRVVKRGYSIHSDDSHITEYVR